ncbi:hypothetical protein V0R37_22685, partial [Pollutimonas sp. H1-120]|uniref:hypothetical protein n=1 Tax=Pollutimonas sp. H1-120 TaxID=3148824 RepID=UPI003B518C85
MKKLEEVKVVNVIATKVRGGETIRCRAKVYSTGMVDTDVSDIPTVSTSTPAVLNLQNAEMLIKASVGNMEAKLIILP